MDVMASFHWTIIAAFPFRGKLHATYGASKRTSPQLRRRVWNRKIQLRCPLSFDARAAMKIYFRGDRFWQPQQPPLYTPEHSRINKIQQDPQTHLRGYAKEIPWVHLGFVDDLQGFGGLKVKSSSLPFRGSEFESQPIVNFWQHCLRKVRNYCQRVSGTLHPLCGEFGGKRQETGVEGRREEPWPRTVQKAA